MTLEFNFRCGMGLVAFLWGVLGAAASAAVASPRAGAQRETEEKAQAALPAEAERGLSPSTLERSVPFQTLVDRSLGQTGRAVLFDWRKSAVLAEAVVGELLELNNFRSTRFGIGARWPGRSWIFGAHAAYVWARETPSSRLVALTPYRQAGRPSRFELDASFELPLAEGVATIRSGWFPSIELVLAGEGRIRYLVYPTSFRVEKGFALARALIKPRLGAAELEGLREFRLGGMQVETPRYNTLLGLRLDAYLADGMSFQQGALLAVPLNASASGLRWWWELRFGMGYAFP